jgi:hypothetical protein
MLQAENMLTGVKSSPIYSFHRKKRSTVTPTCHRKILGGHARVASHQVARVEAHPDKIRAVSKPKPALLSLPIELHFCLKDYLALSEQALLAFTCKDLQAIHRDSWNKLKSNPEERLDFLSQLDRSLANNRFCSACSRFHPRLAPSESSAAWYTDQARTECGELNVPLSKGLYLSWPMIQLAIRSQHYKSLEYGYDINKLPCTLPDTVDDREGITWHHSLTNWREDGHLMLSICTYRDWHGSNTYRDIVSRGFHISLARTMTHDQGMKINIALRRVVQVASMTGWTNLDSPGWQPPHREISRIQSKEGESSHILCEQMDEEKWYTPFLRAYDSQAGLPGLHWTELSQGRAMREPFEWSNWRWCDETGLPLPDVDAQ